MLRSPVAIVVVSMLAGCSGSSTRHADPIHDAATRADVGGVLAAIERLDDEGWLE